MARRHSAREVGGGGVGEEMYDVSGWWKYI